MSMNVMHSDLMNFTLKWLYNNANYSWLLTLIISSAESIAIIGTIIPGSITMSAIGALVGAGVFPLWSTMFWAFCGAIIGDGISYFIGYYFKDRLRQTYLFNSRSSLMQKGENFFKHYGGLSVLLGRFVGPIRAIIPLIAGMMGMKPRIFIIANVLSAAGWAPVYMLPGMMLGMASVELPPAIANSIILIIITWLIVLWLCIYLLKKIPLFIHRHLLSFCTKHYHSCSNSPQQLILAMYFSISVISFITLASYIYNYSSSNIVINQVVYQFFANISNDYGKHLMFYLTTLGQSYMVLLGSGAIIIYLLFSKQIRLVVHILGLLAMTLVTTTMLKNLTHSIRPTHIFKSYSFPSGHTTIATVFYGGLLLLVYKQLQPKTRKLALIITSFVIAGVAISRLYLGVHWLTDITGGFLLGISLLILSTMLYNRKPQPLSHNKNFISVMLMSCLVAYGVYAYSNRNELHRYLYKEPIPMKVKTLKSWYQQDADFLDSWHLNVLGFKSQKINIEWLGKINRICAILLDNGWKEPEPMAWSDIFFRLSGVKSAEHLPLIDPKYLDQPAKIIAIKRIKTNQLLVLRLWPANIHLHGTTDDLWVGVIAVVPRTYSWLSSKYNTTISPSEDLLFNPKVPSVNPYIPRPIVIKPGKKADIMLLK